MLRAGQHQRPDAATMRIVQRGATMIADRPVALAESFYHHLFSLAPGVRSMFPADMTAQNDKLCGALLTAIQALVEPERYADGMERDLEDLGRQHSHRFGVLPAHYPYVGQALVRAVRDVTGDRTTSTSSAWIWVYDWLTAHMLAPRQ